MRKAKEYFCELKKKKSKMRVFGKEESVRKLTEAEVRHQHHLSVSVSRFFGVTEAFAIYGTVANFSGCVEEERKCLVFYHLGPCFCTLSQIRIQTFHL